MKKYPKFVQVIVPVLALNGLYYILFKEINLVLLIATTIIFGITTLDEPK